MSINVKACFDIWKNQIGKNGKKHDSETKFRPVLIPPKVNLNGWNIKKYKNDWGIIEKCLT